MTTTLVESLARRQYVTSSPTPVPPMPATIVVVDGDDNGPQSLARLIAAGGFTVESCASAEEFLSRPRPTVPCCLLLDASLTNIDALALQQCFASTHQVPFIMLTGPADVRVTVKAMKAGATDVLAKPVDPNTLLIAVDCAIGVSRAAQQKYARLQALRACYASLTPREREVMALVVSGLLNKQIGFELGISEITVKAHRGQVTRKMKADSVPHLVRMAARLDLGQPE